MTPPPLTPSRLAQLRIGFALRRRLGQRRAYDGTDAAARQSWRAARLTELLSHAIDNSQFYRLRHAGLLGAPLRDLPVLVKADLVENFDLLVTDGRLRRADLESRLGGEQARGRHRSDRYRMAISSGSSGSPTVLAFDEAEWVDLIANAARARSLAGSPAAGRVRSAKVGSPSPWHLSSQVPATLQDPRKPSLALSAAAPIGETVAALQAWSPTILSSYPSMLRPALREQQAGSMDISPKLVFSSGEHLSELTRDLVREVWGVEVFDQYVATEVGFIAAECPAHDGLHVLDDHVEVEVVDDDGMACPAGVEGHVLVTALHSRTIPLIRYRLGDRATLAEGRCSCGRPGPRLSSIAGRERDLLTFRSAVGPQDHVTLHPVTMTAVLDRLAVGSWLVVHGPELMRLMVSTPAAGFDASATEAELKRTLSDAGAHRRVEVRVEVVEAIETSASGKATRFQRLDEVG